MESKYNEVYTRGCNCGCDGELTEVDVEYLYLTIPAKYVCLYHKLLTYMADFGKAMVDSCDTLCQNGSKNIISCWNIFQSALACYALGKTKEADFFANYVEKQLELIYKGTGKTVYHNSVPLAITPNGKLKAIVSCAPETHFFVDAETGELYQEYLASQQDGRVYTLEGEDLTAKLEE